MNGGEIKKLRDGNGLVACKFYKVLDTSDKLLGSHIPALLLRSLFRTFSR